MTTVFAAAKKQQVKQETKKLEEQKPQDAAGDQRS